MYNIIRYLGKSLLEFDHIMSQAVSENKNSETIKSSA